MGFFRYIPEGGNEYNQSMKWGNIILTFLVGGFVLVVALFGLAALSKEYSRYQKRADAENEVKVLSINVQGQAQRVRIAEQSAEIRLKEAVGIRRAQDQISETLTPLYVQHEMIEALRTSGATTVYIPTDPASGLPVVTTRNAGGK